MGQLQVLYIHHCGIFGGSSRSLCEAIRFLTLEGLKACVLTQNGSVVERFRAAGAEVITSCGISQWDNTRYSYYRGLRWFVLLRELWYLPSTVSGLWRAKRRWPDIDIVHVNEITGVIPTILARWFFRCPVVMHARSVYRTVEESWRSRLIMRMLGRVVDRIVAIDDTVARSLPQQRVEVIHNGFAASEMLGSEETLNPAVETILARPRFKVAMVGNLLAVKGVREFVHAALLIRERGIEADFIFIGANVRRKSRRWWMPDWTGLNQDSRDWIERYIQENGLQDTVHLVGEVMKLANVYNKIDILCFPSYYDAPGRPVFEAAFFGVPSIVAISRPTADTFVHGETGLAISAGDPRSLADAIQHLHNHPAERRRMGEAARYLAEQNFDARKNALKLLALYRSLFPASSGVQQNTSTSGAFVHTTSLVEHVGDSKGKQG